MIIVIFSEFAIGAIAIVVSEHPAAKITSTPSTSMSFLAAFVDKTLSHCPSSKTNSNLSEPGDPLTWTHHTIPTMTQPGYKMAVLENQSMWIIVGFPTTGKRHPFHISNDGINWIPMPSGQVRNQDYDGDQIRSASLFHPKSPVVSNNFNYVFCNAMSARDLIDDTFIENKFYRTEVYINNLTEESSFRDELNPR